MISECNKAVEGLLENDESNPLDKNAHICTGPVSGGIAACSGDSGGPLIEMVPESEFNKEDLEAYDDNFKDSNEVRVRNDSNIPVIRGIVSWGISPCGIKGGPTVFTNVFEYIDFVKKYIHTPSSTLIMKWNKILLITYILFNKYILNASYHYIKHTSLLKYTWKISDNNNLIHQFHAKLSNREIELKRTKATNFQNQQICWLKITIFLTF